ncbi:MAG: histidine phosphatase family protein [Arachnia sp.]
MRPTHLIFLRHGQTDANLAQRMQGHHDVPLNAVGREQASQAADWLADRDLASIYASDLSRASQTGEIVAAVHGLPVVTDPRLREMNVGDWEGRHISDVLREKPDFVQLYLAGIDFRRSATGETIAEMVARAMPAVTEIIRRHAGQSVVIALHGLLGVQLIQTLLGMAPASRVLGSLGNACYSEVGTFDGAAWLVTHNIAPHRLDPAASFHR